MRHLTITLSVPSCPFMSAADDKTDTTVTTEPTTMMDAQRKKPTAWNVRDSLGSLDAMRRYDEYLKEHKRRLRQLEKEARGEMSPSGEWYTEG